MLKSFATALFMVAGLSGPATAQMVVPTEPISFPAGANTATFQHKIVGKDVYGFTFEGQAGQSVTISLEAVTPSANFVLARSGEEAGLFSSMTTGDTTHTEVLPADGEYVIRLFLVGQAAETGSSDMTVTVTLDGAAAVTNAMAPEAMAPAAPQGDFADGLAGGPDYWQVHGLSGDTLNVRTGPGTDHAVVGTVGNGAVLKNEGCAQPGTTVWCKVSATDGSNLSGWASSAYLREGSLSGGEDAMVEGTNYHAIGSIPCTIEANAAINSCEFGVTRGSPGLATVFITLPNGFVRVISFSDGVVSPMSAVTTFDFQHSGDETSITIDNGAETYVIPDAVIFGG